MTINEQPESTNEPKEGDACGCRWGGVMRFVHTQVRSAQSDFSTARRATLMCDTGRH